jgi:hypothetical protein
MDCRIKSGNDDGKILRLPRYGRACPGHPRLPFSQAPKRWMPATSAGMTGSSDVAGLSAA